MQLLDDYPVHAMIVVANDGYRTCGQCVYLMRVDSGYWKIGIARDPEQRRRELQTGNPEKIAFQGGTLAAPEGIDARALEGRLHAELWPYRVNGEWFKASEAEIMAVWTRVLVLMSNEFYSRQFESIYTAGALSMAA